MFLTGLALGFTAGYYLHKFLSGEADVEAEAFVYGYGEGYFDGKHGHPSKYGILDAEAWRKCNDG